MNEKDMQHGQYWYGQDISGWIATEKFNGCRAYWDGQNLWSRGGINISIPESWREALPSGIHLDGEIYDGIDGVYRCGAAIKYGNFTPSMRFMVFDCPKAAGTYLHRLKYANDLANNIVVIVTPYRVSDIDIAVALLGDIKADGGEGIMLRDPAISYTPGRTYKLLKLKSVPT
jgi:DNA ligase 1